MTNRRSFRFFLLVIGIGTVSFFHYLTPTSYMWVHPLLQRAYYIPILLMALGFGWRGGLAGAVIAGASYIPHILMSWGSNPEYTYAQYVEIGMFFLIATLTGVLADMERNQKKKIEETAQKLSETYAQLQASVEQLRRADRLAALGELSAGLAHEIRNPLGALEGAVNILKRSELPEPTRREFSAMASNEVDRLKVLLTHFLDFARPQPPRRTSMEPALLLESVSRLASETARMSNVQVELQNGTSELVSIDAEQIKQVLLNLVLNAVQAMPRGGKVQLRSESADGFVFLLVMDEGAGIAPENLDRIFDPFFTTRAQGTGLGLSIAHQIVTRHGGELSVQNNSDHGATFTIKLPITPIEADSTGEMKAAQ